MRAVDWLLRTGLLVLSCLATLSLIGALSSVSSGSLGDAFPGRVEVSTSPQPPSTQASAPVPSGDRLDQPPRGTNVGVAPNALHTAELARWLKALTYALLALTGFVAAAVVALVRIGTELRRMGER